MARTATAKAPKPPELIDGLTRDEAVEYVAIHRELAGNGESLREFIARIAPEHAPVPRHLDPLIDVLERARHERVKVCISMPPGHAKTLTILRAIAWWLSATPEDTCAYLSYSDRQAWSKSKICRDVALEAGVELDQWQAAAAEWRTTDGGGCLAAGVDGRITGQRVTGLAIFDDPFKSRDDANSTASRESVWTFYTTVVRTRLENASVVVVHTRWHEDDLIGRLAKKDGWEVVNLSAIYEPANDNDVDPLGRRPGEALWPSMYPVKELIEIRKEIGEYDFCSIYQGKPRPRGANVFGAEHYYDQDRQDFTGMELVLATDSAASQKTTANYSVIIALHISGRGINTKAYVKWVYREQVTIPQFARDLRAAQLRFGNPRAGVEAVAGFKAVPQLLREVDPSLRIKEIIPLGDKFQRAQPGAAAWNDGRVLVPLPTDAKPVPWLKEFLAEFGLFTGVNDASDDQVDAFSHAWNMGYRSGGEPTERRESLGKRRI